MMPARKKTKPGGNNGVLNKNSVLGVAVALCSVPALAQQDPATVTIQTQKLTNNVYMLMGDGGNIGLSTGADGSVLIDTEYAPLNAKILAAVRSAGGSDVKYVINTHWHGDHTGGNEPLGKAGAVIIAHDNVLARLSTEQFMAAFNQKVPPAPAAARPVVTYPTRTTFYLNGDVVQIVHIPNAHTDGD
jgi:glyoxylase-like metal-dependent hydrolase (beta-lactamase superfamily II)